MTRNRRPRRRTLPRILQGMETEPVRQDWLLLTPGQRFIRAWRMLRSSKNIEALHDERTYPRL